MVDTKMLNTIYRIVAGRGITTSRTVMALMRLCLFFGCRPAVEFIFYRFTKEGKQWAEFKRNGDIAMQRIRALVSGNAVLTALRHRTETVIKDQSEHYLWWSMLEVFTVDEICALYTKYLENASDEDFRRIYRRAFPEVMLSVVNFSTSKDGAMRLEGDNFGIARSWAIRDVVQAITATDKHAREEDIVLTLFPKGAKAVQPSARA